MKTAIFHSFLTSLALAGFLQAQTSTDAVTGIIKAFDTYDLVAIGEEHDSPEMYRLYFDLIRSTHFSDRVDDIVFEAANAKHQPLIDRYISGGAVAEEELAKVWRDATNSGAQNGDSPLYIEFFRTVREANTTLPEQKKLRVLAGDPPVDWSKIQTQEDLRPFMSTRDVHYGSVVINEVLKKGRKALLISGAGHFYENVYPEGARNSDSNLVRILRTAYPGSLFIAMIRTDGEIARHKIPKRSLIYTRTHSLGELPVSQFNPGAKLKDEIDAILFMGEITKTYAPSFEHNDPYYQEYLRRRTIASTNPFETETAAIVKSHDVDAEKRAIKKILFDIAAVALSDFDKRRQGNGEAQYNAFVIPDGFNDRTKNYFFEVQKIPGDPDSLKLFGRLVNGWQEKKPLIEVQVGIDKDDSFAIHKVTVF